MSARGQQQSPLNGEATFSEQQRERMARRRAVTAPVAAMPGLVPGGLYGTDGAHLYLIDKATGVANLIGPHGAVPGRDQPSRRHGGDQILKHAALPEQRVSAPFGGV